MHRNTTPGTMILRALPILFLAATLSGSGDLRAGVVAGWVEVARANNADILRARAEFRAATAKVPQVKSLPDPRVELESMGTDTIGSEQTMRLAQDFPWPGTLGQRGEAASLQARAFWHETQSVELRVVGRIRAVAAEIAYLQKEAALIAENIELYKKQEIFLEQTARGGGEVSDLVRVEMESGLLGDEIARVREMIRREKAELEALVGRPVADAELARIGEPRIPPGFAEGEPLAARLEATNPVLQSLDSRAEAARTGVRLARLEAYPGFMLGAGYRRVSEPGMGGGREWMNEGVVMVSVSLPIWGGKNKGVRDEAAALHEAAVQERESAARILRAQLESLLSKGRDATRRAGLFRDQLLPKARQAHEAVEASYRAGKASLLDVFDSRRRLLDTETGYWRAVADSQVNQAEIGTLFGTEILQPRP